MKIPRPYRISAVLFDFDGTLTRPGALDFSVIKNAVGCPLETPVLEFIEALPDPAEKERAIEALAAFESEGARNSEPNHAAEEIIAYIRELGLPMGIITRNSRESLELAMANFSRIDPADFQIVITRDDSVAPKPSPEGILTAARHLDTEVREILVVGDFIFDVESGHRAGAVTVLLDNGDDEEQTWHTQADFRIPDLNGIRQILKMGRPLAAGKLPNELLGGFLREFGFEDPSVLISAGIGDDTAAVDVETEQVAVLKSDPITFATDAIGQYAVLVNANDIATSGAVPRWFLTTLMFPVGITASDIYQTMQEIYSVCRKWGISLCGGHTEITDAVTRPVVVGMMAGTVEKARLVDKRNMKTGDKVLLTKGVAVEGTAIIAREFETRLMDLGMPADDIESSKNFLSRISILAEAKIAAGFQGVSAMHDVTEGGLATALEEFSIAGNHKIRIHPKQIHIFPQTKQISELLRIDPLGLIGSGSLLITCKAPETPPLLSALEKAGIQATCIGEVLEQGTGVAAYENETKVQWPTFETDEITRLF